MTDQYLPEIYSRFRERFPELSANLERSRRVCERGSIGRTYEPPRQTRHRHRGDVRRRRPLQRPAGAAGRGDTRRRCCTSSP